MHAHAALPTAIEPEQAFALSEAQGIDDAGESVAAFIEALVERLHEVFELPHVHRETWGCPGARERLCHEAIAVDRAESRGAIPHGDFRVKRRGYR